MGRSDLKNEKDWLGEGLTQKKWESLTWKSGKDWLEKWEGLSRKMGSSDSKDGRSESKQGRFDSKTRQVWLEKRRSCWHLAGSVLLALSVYSNSVSISVLSCHCCHPSEFLMTSEDNVDIFSDHVMNATVEIRNSKTRPDNKSITEFFQKNQSTNASFNFIEEAIGKLIKN